MIATPCVRLNLSSEATKFGSNGLPRQTSSQGVRVCSHFATTLRQSLCLVAVLTRVMSVCGRNGVLVLPRNLKDETDVHGS